MLGAHSCPGQGHFLTWRPLLFQTPSLAPLCSCTQIPSENPFSAPPSTLRWDGSPNLKAKGTGVSEEVGRPAVSGKGGRECRGEGAGRGWAQTGPGRPLQSRLRRVACCGHAPPLPGRLALLLSDGGARPAGSWVGTERPLNVEL